MRFSALLPREHLDDTSKDVVRGGMAVVATMVALVLGLLIAGAKSYFDVQSNEITQLAADVVLLDRAFAHFGPDAAPLRAMLKGDVVHIADVMWSPSGSNEPPREVQARSAEPLFDATEKLAAKTDEQRTIKAQVLSLMVELGRLRWLMYAQRQSRLPAALLVALIVWLTLVSLSSGLFARTNPTVVGAYFASALSVASAVWLILEMYSPYTGFIRVSDAAVRAALAQLGS
ncbi:MAG: hypothetical protein JO219_09255 [Candidatus Eremiobacteraeota bacterium]|nr:hypothetical protein [Candidatus Eremiobacteraeota bacterium]MBV8366872.1 hypothetical protein [Candidatus Eremiobacteraeota bacterium]